MTFPCDARVLITFTRRREAPRAASSSSKRRTYSSVIRVSATSLAFLEKLEEEARPTSSFRRAIFVSRSTSALTDGSC